MSSTHTTAELISWLDRIVSFIGDPGMSPLPDASLSQLVEIKERLQKVEDGAFPPPGMVRWARFVADREGKFQNGRFYYGDEAVEIVRKPEVTSNQEATYKVGPTHSLLDALNDVMKQTRQGMLVGLDGRFVLVNFDDQKVDSGIDFGVLQEQAHAWQEVANCIHELDPDWHQNGKPVESAVAFIKSMATIAQYPKGAHRPENMVFITAYGSTGKRVFATRQSSSKAQTLAVRLDAFMDILMDVDRGARVGREQIGTLTVTDESCLLPIAGFDIEQQRIAACVAEMAVSKGADASKWYHFEMKVMLHHGTRTDRYSVCKMKLISEQEHLRSNFFQGAAFVGAGSLGKGGAGGGSSNGQATTTTIAAGSSGNASGFTVGVGAANRPSSLSVAFGVPYGQIKEPVLTRSEQGVKVETGFTTPTPYSKEPGGHPADIGGDQSS